jgi:tripartite-type tricarboxylate transporter receptor subunit TctC
MNKLWRVALTSVVLGTAGVATAETYPQRPVRIIMPTTPGGGNDVLARVIAQRLSETLGKQFFVENIPGAGQNIGMGAAAKAKADGHTILVAMSTLIVNPMIFPTVPFDPIKDFAPVTLIGLSHFVLIVHQSVAAKDGRELVALIKANPGKYSFASPGIGTTPHLLGELLRLTFDLDLVHVPFNGGPAATNAVLAGSTPIFFAMPSLAVPLIREGKVRPLAVTSKTRLTDLPDVPTLAEAGLPGDGADTIMGAVVPAGTPRIIIDLLYREIAKIIAMPDVKERSLALGFQPVGNTPEEFGAYIQAEIVRWSKVIRDAKIRS